MPWQELGVALCLVCVIEGMIPFISPRSYRRAVVTAAQMSDQTLRSVGLASMVLGTLSLYLIN